MQTVSVLPAEKGWVVRSEAIDNELYFMRGARAEAAARRIAEAIAAAGEPARIVIHLRDGTPAGRFLVPPKLPAPEPA